MSSSSVARSLSQKGHRQSKAKQSPSSYPTSIFVIVAQKTLVHCQSGQLERDARIFPLGIEWWTGSRFVFGKWRQDCEVTCFFWYLQYPPNPNRRVFPGDCCLGLGFYSTTYCCWSGMRKEPASQHGQEHHRFLADCRRRTLDTNHSLGGTSHCPNFSLQFYIITTEVALADFKPSSNTSLVSSFHAHP